jgi:hypothetical protein
MKKNIKYLRGLPELEIKIVEGDFVGQLSLCKFARKWKNKICVQHGKWQGMMIMVRSLPDNCPGALHVVANLRE